MIDAIAFVVIVLAGAYFLALGAVALLLPRHAVRFLLAFAGTPRAHYTEMLLRLAIGGSLVAHAPQMYASRLVSLFGWVLLVTTAGLLLLPWRWHHWFAQNVVPPATRYIAAIGLCSLAIGGCLLVALFLGPSA